MANLLVRDDEKEETPRLEKVSLIRRRQIQSPVKGIRQAGCLKSMNAWFLSPKLGYKMWGVLSVDTHYQLT
jgi:hypothetical protein